MLIEKRLCPRCKNDVLITKAKEGFGIICLRCGIRYKTKAENEEKAYEEFFKKFKVDTPDFLKEYVVDFFVDYRFLKETELKRASEKPKLDQKIMRYLSKKGIKLYEFQLKSIISILKGKNVVIVAPTASGKTEAFVLPVIQKILEDNRKGVKALFVYPTKALARDQLKKFKELEKITGISFAVYDGDTSKKERERILDNPPDVVITNPDMLHLHLMHRTPFSYLIRGIKFLVLDEVHEYTGAFGTNVHFIIRRLKRFSDFQIIGASATIGNAKEFAKLLFNESIEVIEEKGRRASIHFLIVYPHASYYATILKLLRKLKQKSLIFVNTHKDAEVLYKLAKKAKLSVGIHRAGLTRQTRHAMEDSFRSGKIRYLISTPTLELGIDIGSVDVVISLLVSYTRLLQRLGRAGRKGQESIGILILRNNDPISNYYKENPSDYFTDIEPAYIEPKNEVIAYYQLLSACLDKPLAEEEFKEFNEIKKRLVEEGLAMKTSRGLVARKKALEVIKNFSIRGIGKNVKIREARTRRIIGERSMPMALRELYPGAIYLHAGETYLSKSFNFREAILEKVKDEGLKTEPLRFSEPEILKIYEERKAFSTLLRYCKLRIKETVHGYIVKEILTNKKIRVEEIPKLEYTFITNGFVFSCPELSLEEELLIGSYHAVEHALIESSNMIIGGGANEIGGISMGASGVIFVYDGVEGGNGISNLLYKRFEKASERALKILEACKCKRIDGCPNCTYSYQCGNNNKPLYKKGAIEALKLLITGERTEIRDFSDEKPYI